MKIGIAGLGLMGSGIAMGLVRKGIHQILVYNRSPQKAEFLLSKGATICASPKELADNCDFVISCVTDFEALCEVLFGDRGIYRSNNKKLIVADATTISPEQSKYCAVKLREAGIEMLGMPVMGGPAAANEGELVPIVAGNKAAYENVKPLIQEIGKSVFYVGEVDGSANVLKLGLNSNIALIAVAISEGMALAKARGIEPSLFVEILNSTYFRTGLSERKGPSMSKNDFEPSFHLRNMLKDLELAVSTALSTGISLPLTSSAQQLFRAANNSGFAEKDYTAIYGFLQQINGLTGATGHAGHQARQK